MVLECLIGKDGTVHDAKVLRGLPSGLTEAAGMQLSSGSLSPEGVGTTGSLLNTLYIVTVRFKLD